MKSLLVCLVAALLTIALAGAQVEIAYDDGTAEDFLVWNEAGNGAAVRFTLGSDSLLVGARLFIIAYFQNPLGICVLDASGPDGAPGDTLCPYFTVPFQHGLPFKDVAFPTPISTPDHEVYVVYLQTCPDNGDANRIGVDHSGPADNRSWRYEDGLWSHMAPAEGDVMIRAMVSSATAASPSTWGALKALYQ
jgi:hypothetical protein